MVLIKQTKPDPGAILLIVSKRFIHKNIRKWHDRSQLYQHFISFNQIVKLYKKKQMLNIIRSHKNHHRLIVYTHSDVLFRASPDYGSRLGICVSLDKHWISDDNAHAIGTTRTPKKRNRNAPRKARRRFSNKVRYLSVYLLVQGT